MRFLLAHPDAKPTGMARIYKALSEYVPTPLQHALARGYIGTQYTLSNRSTSELPAASVAIERKLQLR